SSDTARMRALTGSVISAGMVSSIGFSEGGRHRIVATERRACVGVGASRALLPVVPTKLSALAIAAAGGMILLARALELEEPTAIDRWVRRMARAPRVRSAAKLLSPLFPLGLPGGYITIAYLVERQVARRTGRRAPAIPRAAWAGWIVHRGFKLFYRRVRPRRPGEPRRTDSYPSGHTTGVTALAFATGRVLRR